MLLKYKEYYPDADELQLVEKLCSFRTNFRKKWKRINDSGKSHDGINDITVPALWYFEDRNFLMDQEESGTSQRTIMVDEDE